MWLTCMYKTHDNVSPFLSRIDDAAYRANIPEHDNQLVICSMQLDASSSLSGVA